MAENPHSQSFDQVLRDELAHIRYRREVIHRWAGGDRSDPGVLLDPEGLTGRAAPPVGGEPRVSGVSDASSALQNDRAAQDARKEALKENLAGLAFSGGGIRAATFAVGIMQGLAGLKLLRFFDVISSVSGGGYANSWLGAWVRREGDPLNVEKQLDMGRIEQSEARRFPIAGERNSVGNFSQVVDEEPEPLHHLRQFSSFLNPRPGLLSADTWTVVAIYLRNVTINLLLLLPLVVAVALLGWTLVVLYRDLLIAPEAGVSHSEVMPGPWQRLYGAGAIVALVAVFVLNAGALWTIRARPDRESRIGKGRSWAIVGLLLAAAVMLTITYQPMLNQAREFLPRIMPRWFSKAGMGEAGYLSRVNLIAHAVMLGGVLFVGSLLYWARYTVRRWGLERQERHNRAKLEKSDLSQTAVRSAVRAVEKADEFLAMHRERMTRGQGWMWEPVAALVAGATGGLLVCCVEELLRPTIESTSPTPWLLAMIGPPLLLGVVIVAITVLVALLGPRADEQEREWWARLSAGLLLTSIYWVVLIATIVYGPCLLLGSRRLVTALLATGWVGTTIAGVLAGKSRTSGTGDSGSASGGGGIGGFVVKLFVAVGPTVFLLGLLAASSLVVAMYFRSEAISGLKPASGFREASAAILDVSFLKDQNQLQVSVWTILGTLIAVLVSACAVLPFVNVNLFSLHAMYANRLTRTFLGASRRKEGWRRRWATVENDSRVLAGAPTGATGSNREPNPVTGFDRGDDLDLLELRIGQGDERARYWGPHLIFNTALNLVGGQELAWRDRKAESFAMTPLYTGSRTTGYAVTGPETRGNVSVGKAVAVSGAAVDPNMSFYQSGPMTALLTVFNARLGVWIQNPNRETWRSLWNTQKWENEKWSGRGAAFGGLLLRELRAGVNSGYRYVHLSDGGHFDNLGVYELIRRRCRYIVAVDATENSNATSDNLGVLIRLCRVDFGIRIQIDTKPLTLSGPDRLSATHVVIGLIRYDDVDHGQTPGMLVYVRSSMTGDEPPDVQQYANLHPEFPRQLTLSDQSFDEDQFESYRALGDHIARTVFEPAARELFRQHDGDQEWWSQEGFSGGRTAFIRGHRKLFTSLRNCWSSPMEPAIGGGPVDWSRRWERLQRDLRREPALAELARELYPELPRVEVARDKAGQEKPISEAAKQAATVHAMEQVLQLMEDTWMGLKGDDAAAMSGGWLNTLRRLTGTESFRRYWPMLSPQYSREFARFCEQTLRVKTGRPEVVGATQHPEDLAELGRELAREWSALVMRRENETLAEAGARFLNELAKRAIDPYKKAGIRPADSKLVTPLAWQVVQRPVEHQASREGELSFPVGVLFVCPIEKEEKQRIGLSESGPCFELLVWIRRAHRGVGLGERVLQTEEFQELVQWLESQGASLLVRYPETPEVAVEDQNRLSWLSFFSLYDFEPVGQMRLKPGKEWRLVRKFG